MQAQQSSVMHLSSILVRHRNCSDLHTIPCLSNVTGTPPGISFPDEKNRKLIRQNACKDVWQIQKCASLKYCFVCAFSSPTFPLPICIISGITNNLSTDFTNIPAGHRLSFASEEKFVTHQTLEFISSLKRIRSRPMQIYLLINIWIENYHLMSIRDNVH